MLSSFRGLTRDDLMKLDQAELVNNVMLLFDQLSRQRQHATVN
jgi:hypothetical protein